MRRCLGNKLHQSSNSYSNRSIVYSFLVFFLHYSPQFSVFLFFINDFIFHSVSLLSLLLLRFSKLRLLLSLNRKLSNCEFDRGSSVIHGLKRQEE